MMGEKKNWVNKVENNTKKRKLKPGYEIKYCDVKSKESEAAWLHSLIRPGHSLPFLFRPHEPGESRWKTSVSRRSFPFSLGQTLCGGLTKTAANHQERIE